MTLLRTLLATLLAALPLFAGAEDRPAPTVVTGKDADGKVTLKKGGTLLVKLEGQAGTGFTWVVVKNDEKVLEPAGKPTAEKIDKTPKLGGKELVIHRFTAAGAGETILELHYKRPFEKGKAPARKFSITVTVQ